MTGISTDIRRKPVLLKLDPALIDTIDSLRGDTPRTVWITRAIEAAMQNIAPSVNARLTPEQLRDLPDPTGYETQDERWRAKNCNSTRHMRAKARHGRCPDCGEKP